MTIPSPRGPFRDHLDAAVRELSLRVNRETVLQARNALLAEADRLDDAVLTAQRKGTRIGLCGGDPVSVDAMAAFNERIDALLDGCLAYNRDLRTAAHALDDTARAYGHSEDEIATSFQGHR